MKEIDFNNPDKKESAQSMAPLQSTNTNKEGGAQNPVPRAPILPARREMSPTSQMYNAEDEPKLSRIIYTLLLVIAFGIGVGGYALFGTRMGSHDSKVATSTAPDPTTDITVDIANSPRQQILADISIAFAKTYLPIDQRRQLVFFTKNQNGDKVKATSLELLSALSEQPLPSSLGTSLESGITYQIHSGSKLSGILILSSRSYANTFATMFDWEPDMSTTLIPILDPLYNRTSMQALRERPFTDKMCGTVSVRALTNLDNEVVLAYGFVDKKTLVIAGTLDGICTVVTKGVKVQ